MAEPGALSGLFLFGRRRNKVEVLAVQLPVERDLRREKE
jgi:hypothetical protein